MQYCSERLPSPPPTHTTCTGSISLRVTSLRVVVNRGRSAWRVFATYDVCVCVCVYRRVCVSVCVIDTDAYGDGDGAAMLTMAVHCRPT